MTMPRKTSTSPPRAAAAPSATTTTSFGSITVRRGEWSPDVGVLSRAEAAHGRPPSGLSTLFGPSVEQDASSYKRAGVGVAVAERIADRPRSQKSRFDSDQHKCNRNSGAGTDALDG